MVDDIFLSRYPSIDLHGEIGDIAKVRVKDFIEENIILGIDTIIVIHGIGEGIVKNSVYEMLKINKDVISYNTDAFNRGCTIVKLRLK